MLKKSIEPITNSEGSKKLFKNPILDLLSKNHVAVPLTIFYGSGILLAIFGMIYYNVGVLFSFGLFIMGLLTFSLLEYLVHRFFYHLPSVYTKGHIPYALHGIHHKYPNDKKRLVMPPILSVLLSALIFGINFYLLAYKGLPFTAGVLFGYATYLTIHFAVHKMKPPNNFLKQLWIHHSIHHFKDDKSAFGVSSPLWDFVFGTLPKKKAFKP